MNNVYKLPLALEPQPEGGYTISCPLLPELVSEADELSRVSANITDALQAPIEAYRHLGRPLPAVLRPLATDTALWTETLIPVPES